MKRKLGLFLVVSFVFVQLISLRHMAEYQFEEHQHHNLPCHFYLQSQYTDDTVPTSEVRPVIPCISVSVISVASAAATTEIVQTHRARAPPLIS